MKLPVLLGPILGASHRTLISIFQFNRPQDVEAGRSISGDDSEPGGPAQSQRQSDESIENAPIGQEPVGLRQPKIGPATHGTFGHLRHTTALPEAAADGWSSGSSQPEKQRAGRIHLRIFRSPLRTWFGRIRRRSADPRSLCRRLPWNQCPISLQSFERVRASGVPYFSKFPSNSPMVSLRHKRNGSLRTPINAYKNNVWIGQADESGGL